MEIQKLTNRILEISKKYDLSHVGSCISVLSILIEIYKNKRPEDLVLLDNGHASVAHYVVLEACQTRNFDGDIIPIDAEELLKKHGIHANRDIQFGLHSTNGSLGHNVGISIGYALADRARNVHVVVSDGSMQEGSNFEALRIKKELKLDNLKIYANLNGYTAVAEINRIELGKRLLVFCPDIKIYHTSNGEGFDSIEGHYKKL